MKIVENVEERSAEQKTNSLECAVLRRRWGEMMEGSLPKENPHKNKWEWY